MTQLEFKQNSHLDPDLTDPAGSRLNPDKLLGRWVNTNYDTQGIAECTVAQDDEGIKVSIIGAGADFPIAWPTVKPRVLINLEEEAGQRTVALTATFDLGFMRAETHMRVNRGVFVIVLFITFLDQSGRANYVTREFFYRQD